MLGCDLVHLPRFKKRLQKGGEALVQSIFHKSELADSSIAHLAGIFAAKEAAIKSLGLPPGDWLQLNVTYTNSGAPELSCLEEEITSNIHISITHDGDYAFAVAYVNSY